VDLLGRVGVAALAELGGVERARRALRGGRLERP